MVLLMYNLITVLALTPWVQEEDALARLQLSESRELLREIGCYRREVARWLFFAVA